MGKACNMHGGDNECIHDSGGGSEENGPVKNSLHEQVVVRPQKWTAHFCNYTSY